MATISVYRPLQRCHGIKFLLNWILRPNQFLQKFLSCFQFPAADIIWVILNIWPNVVFLLLKGRDMQHATCWWYPDTSCAVLQETTSLVTMSGADHGSTTAAFHIVLRRALSWAKQSRCWAGTCFVCRLPPRLIFQPLPCLHPLLSCSSYCCQYHT